MFLIVVNRWTTSLVETSTKDWLKQGLYRIKYLLKNINYMFSSDFRAWGCFDEFNRISVEVLSVVAVQVKSVQDAIRDKKDRFNFMGEMIAMVPTVFNIYLIFGAQ